MFMEAKSSDCRRIDALKEVVRLLNLALDDCRRTLAEVEQTVRSSGQDNDREADGGRFT
jgi:hypothetical protein